MYWSNSIAAILAIATSVSAAPAIGFLNLGMSGHHHPKGAPSHGWHHPKPNQGGSYQGGAYQGGSDGGSYPSGPSYQSDYYDANNNGGQYAQTVMNQHNMHRRQHGVPDLVWDDNLASTASKIGQSCVYAHDTQMDGGNYGQNIAAGVPAGDVSQVVTRMWYETEVGNYQTFYGYEPPSNLLEEYGHFSQMVWASTQRVGCATVSCPSGLANIDGNTQPSFTICNYFPAGNIVGEYAQNVFAPGGQQTEDPSYQSSYAQKV